MLLALTLLLCSAVGLNFQVKKPVLLNQISGKLLN